MRKILGLMALALWLAGCGEQATNTTDEGVATAAASLVPADAELAEIYQRSCRNCHVNDATGAPLTGDIAAWQPRMEQGMDTVLQHVIDGYGGMPPLGLCFECDEQQFIALIQFMANGESH